MYKESGLFFINPGLCVNIIYVNDQIPTGHNLDLLFKYLIASLGWNDIILIQYLGKQ